MAPDSACTLSGAAAVGAWRSVCVSSPSALRLAQVVADGGQKAGLGGMGGLGIGACLPGGFVFALQGVDQGQLLLALCALACARARACARPLRHTYQAISTEASASA